MSNNSAPTLRFVGLDGDWRPFKLAELYDYACSGGTPSSTNSEYYNGDIPFLGISDITERVVTKTQKSITEAGLNNSTAVLIPSGAISLAMYASVGKVAITGVPVATSQAFFNMVFSSEVIRDFVFVNLEKADLFSEWETLISTGTQRNLNAEKVKNWVIMVPSEKEQRLISNFFARLDALIAAHQRQYDRLLQTRKALLQKLFPRFGKNVPELRFSGYTAIWEQHTLKELLVFQNGFNGSGDAFGSGTPLISVMDILGDGFITYNSIRGSARLTPDEQKRYTVEYGDVLFQRSSETFEDAGTSNVYLDKEKPAAFGGFVIRGKKIAEYDPVFIKYLLSTASVRSQITSRAQGAQHINVSQNTLSDVVVSMPKIEEQTAIGRILYELDKISTLNKQKIVSLTNLKSALLQKVFPAAVGGK